MKTVYYHNNSSIGFENLPDAREVIGVRDDVERSRQSQKKTYD